LDGGRRAGSRGAPDGAHDRALHAPGRPIADDEREFLARRPLHRRRVQHARYGLAINRIRGYYKQLAGDQADLLLLSGHDDGRGVFANASVPPEGRTQYFTFGTVVAVINSVVGGSAVAIALGAFVDASLGVAAGRGVAVAIGSVIALLRFADRLLDARTGVVEPLFPSRSTGGAPRPGPEH
jgi:hypothetical protein